MIFNVTILYTEQKYNSMCLHVFKAKELLFYKNFGPRILHLFACNEIKIKFVTKQKMKKKKKENYHCNLYCDPYTRVY